MRFKFVCLAGFGIEYSNTGILSNRSELAHLHQSFQNNQEKMSIISVK